MAGEGKKAVSSGSVSDARRGSGNSGKVDSSDRSSSETPEGETIGEPPTISGASWRNSVRPGRLFGAEKIRLVPLLVGRDALLTTIKDDLISGCRVLALCGQRGIGKTSLAVKLLELCGVDLNNKTLAGDCPFDRVVYIQVSEKMSFHSLIKDLARFLEITLKPKLIPDQLISVLIRRLRLSRCLIVLDNLEALLKVGQTISEEWGELLRALINSDYKSQILITNLDTSNQLFESNNANAILNSPTVTVRHITGISTDDSMVLLRERGLQDSDADLHWIAEQTHGHVQVLLDLAGIAEKKDPGYLRKYPNIVSNHINAFSDSSVNITVPKKSKLLRIQQFQIQTSQNLKPLFSRSVYTLQRVCGGLKRRKLVPNLVRLRIQQKLMSILIFPRLELPKASKKLPIWMGKTSYGIIVVGLLGIIGFHYCDYKADQVQDKKLLDQTKKFSQDLESVQQLKNDLKNKHYTTVLKASLPDDEHLKSVVQRLQTVANSENLKSARQLEQAQAFLKKKDIQLAINTFKQIPKDTDSYPTAQKAIADITQKSEKAFKDADVLEKQNKSIEALKLLKEIPEGVSISTSARNMRDRIEKKMFAPIDLPPTAKEEPYSPDSSIQPKAQDVPETEQAIEPHYPTQYQPDAPRQPQPVDPAPVPPSVQPLPETPDRQPALEPPRDGGFVR